MVEDTSAKRPGGGKILFGLGLAAVLAALGYRAFQDGEVEETAGETADPIAVLEERVGEQPADVAAWQELAFARFERGEFTAAAAAYREAARLDPEEAVLWSALGEALVMASQRDPLPPDALAAFRKAVELDPADPRARYFLAVKRDLDGDHDGALGAWLDLMEDTPPGAPWESDLARTIEQVATINGIDVSSRLERAMAARSVQAPAAPGGAFGAGDAIPGPSAEQVAAAASMAPGEQRQMAEGMVASLESKLVADPSNVDGWVMLMRSRMTLGQPDRARKALADAVAANPAAAPRLRMQAEALGIR
ncbi:tetratricopeptide repeat protein [Qipengyuania flava]|uniref:tetratricopeptide repeat protein n=1 Tax=Qipengyuania flava TaxID=192812 RepID=UPI001C62B072|nr:tetratricopeptide repeat protein [Qipengyuania flava]QYJ07783.1 tetratricopeptide repeat protein [Qipengyuania flava]